MDRLFLVASLSSVALIFMVMYSLRREHIRVEYSVSWLAAASLMLFLSRWPTGLELIGAPLGVRSPHAVLLSILVGVLLLVLYRVSLLLSHLRDNNVALAQKVAILEYRIGELAANADRR